MPETIQPEEKINELVLSNKYKNSGLSKQKSVELSGALGTLMNDRKPHQDSELTLFILAKQLSIHPNYLSQIINQRHS